ncbi:MAG: MFS transporter [Oscillospiraceae bacterium]|nr:MFS transporter [Oscillospiraceae bacterium]
MEDKKQTRKNLIMFPLGTVGRDMVYSLVTNFLLTFVLFTRSLTAAQLSAITAIMVGARIFDALNDPIMGNIIERTRTKWGKFKPWIVIGMFSTSAVIYAAFNTKLQGWSFVWFFGLIYFLYSITYTMGDISYWGMIPALSSDGDTRNAFTARTTLFAGIGGTAASILIPLLTTGANAIGGSTSVAYGRIALAIAFLAPAFLCFVLFGVRERREDLNEPVPPVSFKKIWSTISGNDQLIWIAVIFLIHEIGNGVVMSGIGSTYIYFEFGYEGGLYSLFTTVGMSVTALLMVFYPAISRRLPRKKLMGVLVKVSTLGYILMIGVLALRAGEHYALGMDLKFLILTIGYMLANFGQYGFYLILMISVINTVEYNEYLHGTRDEGIITSLRPFLTKLASALTVVIASATYMLAGVTKYTNQISTFENAAASGQMTESDKLAAIHELLGGVSHSQSVGLLLVMTVLPYALMLLSYKLYLRRYNLDEAEYDRICGELNARRESKSV